MSKFRPFNSPIKRFVRKFGNLGNLLIETYYKLNPFDDYHPSDEQNRLEFQFASEFLSAFNPFIAMAKDVRDTFKPYKSAFYLRRDFNCFNDTARERTPALQFLKLFTECKEPDQNDPQQRLEQTNLDHFKCL